MAASFNAPILGVVRVFRKDFDLRTSLQYVWNPPDQEIGGNLAPKLSPSLRKCHFELTARGKQFVEPTESGDFAAISPKTLSLSPKMPF